LASSWAPRQSRGAKPATCQVCLGVEVAWAVIPFIIVIAMALPATKTVVAMKDTSNAEVTVKATGYQWKWGYEYVDGPGTGISFLSNLSTPLAQMASTETKGDNYLMEVDKPLTEPVHPTV